jgi:hypothetical protein
MDLCISLPFSIGDGKDAIASSLGLLQVIGRFFLFTHQAVHFQTIFLSFMKNTRTPWQRLLLASTTTVLLSTGLVAAQGFVQPNNNEDFITATSAPRVENTGTGVCSDGANYLHVSVWDGAAPAFGWSYNGATQKFDKLDGVNKGYSVYDPDIVGYYDASGAWYMAAVYLARTGTGPYTVRYEVQRYNPSTNAWGIVTPSTRIDNSTTAPCKSPNLDVNRRTGDAVIVFEQNGSIYARTRKFTGALTGLRRVACNGSLTVGGVTSNYTHYDPDVAAYGDNNGGTAPDVVSITYVTQISGGASTLEVDLVQSPLATIQTASAGCSPIAAGNQVAYAPVPSTHLLDRPRIAAPEFAPSNADPYDCIIAARYNDNFGDQIITMTRRNASYGPAGIDVQQQNTLTASQANVRPVVTYGGDGALLLWQYDDNGMGNTSNTVDILGMWLHWDGLPMTGDMLIANAQQTGTQSAPSVEARGYSRYVSSTALMVWADDAKQDVAYKPAYWNSGALRPSATGNKTPENDKAGTTQMAIYPNPVDVGSRIELHLAAQEAAQALQVFEPRTGKVVATLPVESLKAGETSTLALPSLPAGLYVLRLTTNQGVRITRFSFKQ